VVLIVCFTEFGGTPQSFTPNDATPEVRSGPLFQTANTVATTYTDFDFGSDGQVFILNINDALTTIADNANINLQEGINWAPSNGSDITFELRSTVWHEISRRDATLSEVVTATNVITEGENNKTFYLNAVGGFTSTLPAPAIGLKFKFIVSTAPTTAYIITTNSGANILFGTFLDTIGELVSFSAQDTLNFVASASIVGDFLEVESDGTNWYCVAKSGADGGITVSVA